MKKQTYIKRAEETCEKIREAAKTQCADIMKKAKNYRIVKCLDCDKIFSVTSKIEADYEYYCKSCLREHKEGIESRDRMLDGRNW